MTAYEAKFIANTAHNHTTEKLQQALQVLIALNPDRLRFQLANIKHQIELRS